MTSTLWSATQLSRMRATWTASLGDTCQIGTRTGTPDTYNEPVDSYSYATGVACGIEYTSSREVERDPGKIITIDATLRLAHGTTLSHRDRIKLTHRYGTALSTAQTFEVVGYPHEYVAGIVVDLQEVR